MVKETYSLTAAFGFYVHMQEHSLGVSRNAKLCSSAVFQYILQVKLLLGLTQPF